MYEMDLQKQSEESRSRLGLSRSFNIDSFLDAFLSLGSQGVVTAWNLQAENTFGFLRDEAIGVPASELIIPARNRQHFRQTLEAVFGQDVEGPGSRLIITAQRREGTEFQVEAAFFSLRSGEELEVGIFVRPLAPQEPTEVEAEKRYHAVMDQLGECYAEGNLRGRFTFVNKAYCETFGISRERREGHNYQTVFSPEMADLFRKAYEKVYRTGEAAKIDYSMTLHNGKQVFNEQSISLKRDAQGNATGFMVIVRDCFERKQNEMELVRAKQAAEAANQAKGEFLANMSHEIRTPLNGVIGMLELMTETNSTPEQRELIEMAQDAAGSLLVLINDVLDFSRIEAGKLEFDRVEFDPAEIVSQAAAIVKCSAVQKGLELNCEPASGVPRAVLGDPVRLRQVLVNLMGNAVKFTPRGRVQVQVLSEGVCEGRVRLRFSVADSGIGIPPEKQQAIFEAFFQADASTTRKFGGTGLGLAICSRIVQFMGGRIWVESAPGKGSTFYFTAVLEILEDSSRKTEQRVHAAPQAKTRKLRILLVEDNLVNQKLTVRILENLGHRVVVADNGIEALDKMQVHAFDLVFMDVQMPEMDGFAATAAIRASTAHPKVPVVALTAHALKGDRERCLTAGMDDYIAKPVSVEAIRSVLERVMKPD